MQSKILWDLEDSSRNTLENVPEIVTPHIIIIIYSQHSHQLLLILSNYCNLFSEKTKNRIT